MMCPLRMSNERRSSLDQQYIDDAGVSNVDSLVPAPGRALAARAVWVTPLVVARAQVLGQQHLLENRLVEARQGSEIRQGHPFVHLVDGLVDRPEFHDLRPGGRDEATVRRSA